MTRLMFVPDTQIRPGLPLDWLEWTGEYAADKKPDVIVQIGDWYDMHSLSSYDVGKKAAEGARYGDDVEAGNEGWLRLNAPIERRIEQTRRSKRGIWKPKRYRHIGNHEQRIERYVNDYPVLEGKLSYNDLEAPGWELVGDFLSVHWVEGVAFSHYFVAKQSGRPLGGQSIDTRLKTIGHSFAMGHQQVLMFGRRETGGGPAQYGLVAGAHYPHNEKYRGPQAADEWRGIVMMNELADGAYDPMFVSLNYLCRKYEGITLDEYKRKVGL